MYAPETPFCLNCGNNMGEIGLSAEFDWQREFVYFGSQAYERQNMYGGTEHLRESGSGG